MTGDAADIKQRLMGALPGGWFSDTAPILGALLDGFATALAFAYSVVDYTRIQTRILTATDGWLDMVASDFFGPRIRRASGQSDASFKSVIRVNLFRERNTRASIISVLTDLTGHVPELFEPGWPLDTYGLGANLYLGATGGIGSVTLPYQCFVKIHRATGVTDEDIYSAIESVKPAGTIVWTQIHD